MAANDFLHREVPALGRRVHRVGLGTDYGLSERDIDAALERGLNYIYWSPSARALTRVLRRLSPERRERLVIATGPTFGYLAGSPRRRVERVLKLLGSEQIGVLQLYWLGRMSALRPSIIEEMLKLKEAGKVQAIGASIHDRVRAGELAREGPLDLLMIRYNAAHPGAERDIFPHLSARNPALVAYTATNWGRLLRPERASPGFTPSAADCYRFCLTNPHVDVTLMAPKTLAELDENLTGLERGPLTSDEMERLREFGRAVHG
jgi:aryl-alcohol dehydrogenase-like predicted oxidoreductase